jgi:nucleoid-associated protein YgaU
MKLIIERRREIVVGAIAVALLILALLALRPSMAAVKWEKETYRVRSGDSLWSISGEYCPDSVDRQEWIHKVRKLNDIDGSIIYPGQVITILAPEED